jgi:hypothetical protein
MDRFETGACNEYQLSFPIDSSFCNPSALQNHGMVTQMDTVVPQLLVIPKGVITRGSAANIRSRQIDSAAFILANGLHARWGGRRS